MDLAVDITSAMYEITQKKPDITAKELIISGMNIGRAAMGTISTTLLLAYTGSCIAMLMVFMAQGTPLVNILNYKYVAAEIVHTVAGSIGLTAVAPLTAVLGGTVLTYGTKAALSDDREAFCYTLYSDSLRQSLISAISSELVGLSPSKLILQ